MSAWWKRWPGAWDFHGWHPVPAWLLVAIMASQVLMVAAWPQQRHEIPVAVVEADNMQVLVDAWKYKKTPEGPCLDASVSTTKLPGETAQQFADRHNDLVDIQTERKKPVAMSSCP